MAGDADRRLPPIDLAHDRDLLDGPAYRHGEPQDYVTNPTPAPAATPEEDKALLHKVSREVFDRALAAAE